MTSPIFPYGGSGSGNIGAAMLQNYFGREMRSLAALSAAADGTQADRDRLAYLQNLASKGQTPQIAQNGGRLASTNRCGIGPL